MKITQFVEAVRSYGVNPVLTNSHSLGGFYEILLALENPGQGRSRHYSSWHVRRLVAWLTIGALVGGADAASSATNGQRRQATRLLAAATEGFVVMSGGRAWWSLVPPVHAIKEMALVFPAIQWRPEHRPR